MSDQPPERPVRPGLTPGDPLSGSSAPAGYPPGYTSPPPPGAFSAGPGQPPPFAPGTFRLSGWWRRVWATVIDGLIVGVIATILLVPLGIGVANVDSDTGVFAFVGALILTTLVVILVACVYAPVLMARTNGQTFGKMATGIRVIRADGQRMTFGFAAVREILVKGLLVGVISSALFGIAYFVDVLWPLWDEQRRALHDMVVNTRVVEA